MTRYQYIEQIRRLIYNGQPNDDATITIGLVNVWLNQAIGIAAKANYKDNLVIDGMKCINNSFYTTFKGLTVENDDQFTYKITLPQIPFGIGQDEGVSMLVFKDNQSQQLSKSVVWLTANQKTFFQGMRPIPNKLLAISESKYVYVYTTLLLNSYTANITIASGGLDTDLSSELNVPADYIPAMTDYLVKNLILELNQAKDVTNDGEDFKVTT